MGDICMKVTTLVNLGICRLSAQFSKILKIFQNLSEGHTNVAEHFPRITKNCRRLRKTFKENPGMFRLYTNEFEYDLRVKLDISEIIDMFTSEDMGGKHATRVPGGLV